MLELTNSIHNALVTCVHIKSEITQNCNNRHREKLAGR